MAVELGNVVCDFYIGDTHAIICDDYCRDKTKEQIDKILARIAEMAYQPLVEAEMLKAKERQSLNT